MLDPVEWMILVVAALAGGVVVGRQSITVLARLRGKRVTTHLTCPRRACPVECTLLIDEGGACVGVERCSLFGSDAPPRCEQDCAKLINLGIPLDREPLADASARTLIPLEAEPEE